MDCEFCGNEFSNKQNLNAHKKKAKYCLKLQGIEKNDNDYTCDYCPKEFNILSNYKRHVKICKFGIKDSVSEEKINFLQNKVSNLKNKVSNLENVNTELRSFLKDLQERYDNLSLTVVKRPVTNTKNIQINNYIKNMSPLLEDDIKNNVPMLTLEHHVMGAEGYAQYALEFPFKDKIVCVDVSRNKIKYKNEDGDIIEDVGFKKMMTKLCLALKDRSFNLCQEHYEKLSEKITESEMDAVNFMETALAITKYANGRESDFCKNIIKMISRGVKIEI